MSIEQTLSNIERHLSRIADSLEYQPKETNDQPNPPAVTPAPVPAPAPDPVPAPEYVPPAVVPPVVPAPEAAAVPFNDPKTMMAYVMAKYKTLGPVKGGMIQAVLTSLGATNINDVQPDQYAAFHAGVEAIK